MKFSLIFILSFLFSLSTFSYQRVGEIIAEGGENLRTVETINGQEVLTVLQKLPTGTKFKFRTEHTLAKPLIKVSSGQIKKSRSEFLGSLIILSGAGLSESRIKELNKRKIYLYKPSTALAPVIIDVKSEKGALLGEFVNDSSIDPNISRYLKLEELRLPEGSKLSFRPDQLVAFPHYLSRKLQEKENEEDEDVFIETIKKSGARYLGPIQIVSAPGIPTETIEAFNKRELYVYEWHMNKSNMIASLFDVSIPRGEAWITDSFQWDNENPSGGWAHHTANFILTNGTELLTNPPTDVKDFCPAYDTITDEERAVFWIHLMNAIAKKESQFDPSVTNDESGYGDNGNDVISRGLLQISFESSQNRNYQRLGCPISTRSQLHNPLDNLKCGVAIFNHLTNDQNCISCKYPEGHLKAGKFAGIARYWSTLRTPYEVSCKRCSSGKVKLGFKEEILKQTINTPSCKVN